MSPRLRGQDAKIQRRWLYLFEIGRESWEWGSSTPVILKCPEGGIGVQVKAAHSVWKMIVVVVVVVSKPLPLLELDKARQTEPRQGTASEPAEPRKSTPGEVAEPSQATLSCLSMRFGAET